MVISEFVVFFCHFYLNLLIHPFHFSNTSWVSFLNCTFRYIKKPTYLLNIPLPLACILFYFFSTEWENLFISLKTTGEKWLQAQWLLQLTVEEPELSSFLLCHPRLLLVCPLDTVLLPDLKMGLYIPLPHADNSAQWTESLPKDC